MASFKKRVQDAISNVPRVNNDYVEEYTFMIMHNLENRLKPIIEDINIKIEKYRHNKKTTINLK